MKKKILVVYNAPEICENRNDAVAEESVIDSVNSVLVELKKSSYVVEVLPLSPPLEKSIEIVRQKKPYLIFNLCESFAGNPALESNIAALWELLDIPYTGCRAKTLILAQDKIKAKILAMSAGINTPPWELFHDVPKKTKIPFPVIVKPPFEDGSIGINSKSFVTDIHGLREAVASVISRYGTPAMAEKYIDGREFNVAIFGKKKITVLSPAEIDFKALPPSSPKITTYNAKWDAESEEYRKTPSICPAKIMKIQGKKLKLLTLKLFGLFDAEGYARADFRMDNRGEIFFLEFNPNPDISPGAGFRKALEAEKISFANFTKEIIKIATREQ